MHAVLWIGRQLNMRPEELLQCEEGIGRVKATISEMYDGTIPMGLDCSELATTSDGAPFIVDPEEPIPKAIVSAALKKVRGRARPIIPDSDNAEDCERDYRYCVLAKQAHYCCFTCYKKGDECRFHYPRCLNESVSVSLETDEQDDSKYIRELQIKVQQNHRWINHHAKSYLTTCIRSNHDIRYCNNPWGDSFYCLNYTTKEGCPDMNIFTRRVHKALCRHSEDATLLEYMKSTIFQLDACRERGIVEVLSTLLRFKHATFTRSCVKLNTLCPDKRKTNMRLAPHSEQNEEDVMIANEENLDCAEEEEASDVYEVCESVASSLIFEGYKQRPFSGLCPVINLPWDEVSLVDFVAWYRPTKSKSGRNSRIELPDGTVWVARNRRAVVLFVPYIKLNIMSEESAYSVLVSYIPFRDEVELIPDHYEGSAV